MPIALGLSKESDKRRRLRIVTDTVVPEGTLEDRVADLESRINQMAQQMDYLQRRNHTLESVFAATAGLLSGLTESLGTSAPMAADGESAASQVGSEPS